jgi:DNA-binding phage protein
MSRTRKKAQASTPSEVLRAVIEERGLTAYAVAKLAGLPRPDSIQRFLNHERDLRLVTFDAVAAALGLRLVEDPVEDPV